MNENQNTFSTDSFQLASFLLTKSIRLQFLDKTNPKRVIFVFDESEERKLLTEEFLSHQAQVEPHMFFSAQKDLKQMIYQIEGEKNG